MVSGSSEKQTHSPELARSRHLGYRIENEASGIIAGWSAAIAGLAAGELVAGIDEQARAPIAVVADRIIDLVPQAVERWAIDLFGSHDKTALLVGASLFLAIASAVVGRATIRARSPVRGMGVSLCLGLAVGLVGLTGRQGSVPRALPSVAAGLVGAGVLGLFHRNRALVATTTTTSPGLTAEGEAPSAIHDLDLSDRSLGMDRRRLLITAGVVGASSMAAGGIGRFVQRRFQVAAERASVVLPRARNLLAAPGPDDATQIGGLSSFFTPQERFYRIDTAFVVPRVSIEKWKLDITGMVRRPMTLRFEDLLERPMIETDVTIACVSNEVGGDLVGNARWLGVRLDELLDEVGIDSDADQIVGRSVDGWTGGFPVEVLDGRDCIVAVGMNGETLSPAHGYPARLIVPGLYGYVSATKWLREIELTRFDRFEGYWIPRGWSARGPIKLQSRIDTPSRTIAAVPTPIAGVAWDPLHGISRVEVRIDDGDWQDATLGPQQFSTTWRQWWMAWQPTPGRHVIQCRATNEQGVVQTQERRSVAPDGATGWHSVTIKVE